MPYVTCPTCGERGKIPTSLIGVRIKCRKCGLSFQVAPASGTVRSEASAGPSAPVEVHHGIEVEGLDASSWMVPNESAVAVATTAAEPEPHPDGPVQVVPVTTAAREYKLLSSRDKMFEGKFDLARMEEAINQFARQGWAARGMITPHLKSFSGALEEVIVVLLERDHGAA